GQVLELISTDIGSRMDNSAGSGVGRRSENDAGPSRNRGEGEPQGRGEHIPAWCGRTGHELLRVEEEGKTFRYYVRKRNRKPRQG
ncbi:MAG: sulfurtransferase TusA family protein, partial [Sulfuricaulis sp.]|nr:sulfurtransferase TusA family protein [Sulfuricaulis sp.]